VHISASKAPPLEKCQRTRLPRLRFSFIVKRSRFPPRTHTEPLAAILAALFMNGGQREHTSTLRLQTSAAAAIGGCLRRMTCILDIERQRRTVVFAGIFRRANWGLAKQGARVQHDISALDNDRGAIPKPQRLPGRVEQT